MKTFMLYNSLIVIEQIYGFVQGSEDAQLLPLQYKHNLLT